MKKHTAISVYQLYAIFFVSRVLSLFTFIAPEKIPFAPGDRLILFVPFIIFTLVFSVPALIITSKGETPLSLSQTVSPKLTKTVCLVYAAGFLWSLAVSGARFELYMNTVMYPGKTVGALMFLLIAAAVFTALKGTEAEARCCGAILIFLTAAAVISAAAAADQFDPLSLSPPLADGAFPVLLNGFTAAARTTETGLLLFSAPAVNGKPVRSFLIWLISFGVFASVMLGLIAGVTGFYGDLRMFRFFSLTSLSGLGVFRKADDLFMGIWVLCFLFRTAFYLTAVCDMLLSCFDIKNKYPTYFLSGTAVFVISTFLCATQERLSRLLSSDVNPVLYILLITVLPVMLLITNRLTRNRSKPINPVR